MSMPRFVMWVGLFGVVLLAGCECGDSNNNGQTGICAEGNAPTGCGTECGIANPFCPDGLYCSDDGRCTADCRPSEPTKCGDGKTCTFNGHCVASNGGDDGSSTGGCAEVKLDARRKTPNVVLLIDRSSSMNSKLSGGTPRWDAVRNFLIGTSDKRNPGAGILYSLQSQVRFSLTTYTTGGPSCKCSSDAVAALCNECNHLELAADTCLKPDPNNAQASCDSCVLITPALSDPMIMAYSKIIGDYGPLNTGSGTPTGAAVRNLSRSLSPSPSTAGDPTIVILATDGQSKTCWYGTVQDNDPNHDAKIASSRKDAVDAVKGMLQRKNIQTYVIGVGYDDTLQDLQDLANAGIGRDPGKGDANAMYWSVSDEASLQSAFETIINGQVSCDLELSKDVKAEDACSGTITINNEVDPLPCDSDNGWRLIDTKHIRLTGSACDRLKSAATPKINAVFPCGAVAEVI